MTRTRVVELQYRLVASIPFEDAPPLMFENEVGAFRLARNRLHVRPLSEYATTERAAAAIEPVLRAWQLQAELLEGVHSFRFELDEAELIGAPSHHAAAKLVDGEVDARNPEGDELVISIPSYPSLPSIRLTPDLEIMAERFRRARFGVGEPLQACAYYCLTVLERTAGGRAEASTRFRIDKHVLRKLGELTTIHGDPRNARKSVAPDGRALSPREVQWITVAVRGLLLQFGADAAGALATELSMESLPPLA